MLDECYKRVVTHIYPVLRASIYSELSGLAGSANARFDKVRNLRGEQNRLESLARDRDSRVREAIANFIIYVVE